MRYESLNELIRHSSSSRQYFLSLPVDIQMKLHSVGGSIHTAQELRRYEGTLSDVSFHARLGGWDDKL